MVHNPLYCNYVATA